MNPFHQIKSILRRYRRSTYVSVLIISTLSFVLGVSISQLLTRSVGLAYAYVSPIITTIVSLCGILGVFREFFKDRREEKKTPVLEIELIPIKKLRQLPSGVLTIYFLRINKISGEGIADECHGYVDMKDYRHKITIWDSFGNPQYTKISTFEDLLLFGIIRNEIRFLSSAEVQGRFFSSAGGQRENSVNNYINEQIQVDIGSANAKVPVKPFVMKVKDIIDKSRLE